MFGFYVFAAIMANRFPAPSSENPDIFKVVPQERMSRFQNAFRTKLKAHYAKTRSYKLHWCILAVPNFVWATKVFPHLSKEEALQSLWRLILQGARQMEKTLSKTGKIMTAPSSHGKKS